jgi:hypothetical protein
MLSRLAAAILLLAFASAARAVPVTVEFVGTVNAVDDFLPDFKVGDVLRGAFSYDTATVGSPVTWSTLGTEYGAVEQLQFTLAEYVGRRGASVHDAIYVLDGEPSTHLDRIEVIQQFEGAAVSGLTPYLFEVLLDDVSGTSLSSEVLPATLPGLESLSSATWWIQFCPERGRCQRASGVLTEIRAVPEPTSLGLTLAALVAMLLARCARPLGCHCVLRAARSLAQVQTRWASSCETASGRREHV